MLLKWREDCNIKALVHMSGVGWVTQYVDIIVARMLKELDGVMRTVAIYKEESCSPIGLLLGESIKVFDPFYSYLPDDPSQC